MAKCKAPRKRAKRPAPRERDHKLDDEMLELASVIAEFQLDNNAFGWFRAPWRDGWNAVALPHSLWAVSIAHASKHEENVSNGVEERASHYLGELINNKTLTAEAYHRASDEATAISLHPARFTPLLQASFRCYQVLVANSSGGGNVYNDILKRAFDTIEISHFVENLVLEWRCNDAIGTMSILRGDGNDRLRRAFTTAWKRGLYLAAYSLPPAIDYAIKPSIVK